MGTSPLYLGGLHSVGFELRLGLRVLVKGGAGLAPRWAKAGPGVRQVL